jgi:hypothetical protein
VRSEQRTISQCDENNRNTPCVGLHGSVGDDLRRDRPGHASVARLPGGDHAGLQGEPALVLATSSVHAGQAGVLKCCWWCEV